MGLGGPVSEGTGPPSLPRARNMKRLATPEVVNRFKLVGAWVLRRS